jgi:hypothetical protein
LNVHRWELNELKEQLAVLSRLRMDMERQMQALASGAEDDEIVHRRAQLEQSLVQLDEQIKAAQEQINARMRAVRLLEAAPSRQGSATAY